MKHELLGAIVITDYNRKTYRIDDINWDENPFDLTFSCKNDEISLVQYMQTKYEIEVRERRQPILYSRAKKSEIRRGMAENIALIPECCRITG